RAVQGCRGSIVQRRDETGRDTRVLRVGRGGAVAHQCGHAAVAPVGEGLSPYPEAIEDDSGPGGERADRGGSPGRGGAVQAQAGGIIYKEVSIASMSIPDLDQLLREGAIRLEITV